MRAAVLLSAALLTLAGCAGASAKEDAPTFASCDAAAAYYKARKGQVLHQPVPFTPHRVLKPGSVMTMDFNPLRLNVHIDGKGFITDARCG